MAPLANRSRRTRHSNATANRRKRHTNPRVAPRSPLTTLSSPDRRNANRGGSGRSSPFGNKSRSDKVTKRRWKPSKFSLLPSSVDPYEKNCFDRRPMPAGYVFVPKGDVYITRNCRSKTKESQRIVYVVYNKSGKRPLGLRVPSDIRTSVYQSAAETADSRANTVKVRDERERLNFHQLLRSEYPLMPENELETVLYHAFLKGSGRVGRCSNVPDALKARLAVEAHIRHNHTPYDAMLKDGNEKAAARDAVRDTVQTIKAAWEGVEMQPLGLLTLRNRESGIAMEDVQSG